MQKSIADIEKQLQKTKKEEATVASPTEEDSLDSYMETLKKPQLEKQTISKLKSELAKLKKEYEQVVKLLNIAKPAELPPLAAQTQATNKSKLLPVFGKKRKIKIEKPKSTSVQPKEFGHGNDEKEEEEEEEEDEEDKKTDDNVVDKSKESSTISLENKTTDIQTDESVKNSKVTSTNMSKKKNDAPCFAKKKQVREDDGTEKTQKKKKSDQKKYGEGGYDEDYSMWVPPSNQTGDGRTSLNDKLGY